MDYYILDGRKGKEHKVIKAENVNKWTLWFQNHIDECRVALDQIAEDAEVSTVFLGLNHGTRKDVLLFETMVFGGSMDGETRRYATWEEAEKGHNDMVKLVKGE